MTGTQASLHASHRPRAKRVGVRGGRGERRFGVWRAAAPPPEKGTGVGSGPRHSMSMTRSLFGLLLCFCVAVSLAMVLLVQSRSTAMLRAGGPEGSPKPAVPPVARQQPRKGERRGPGHHKRLPCDGRTPCAAVVISVFYDRKQALGFDGKPGTPGSEGWPDSVALLAWSVRRLRSQWHFDLVALVTPDVSSPLHRPTPLTKQWGPSTRE